MAGWPWAVIILSKNRTAVGWDGSKGGGVTVYSEDMKAMAEVKTEAAVRALAEVKGTGIIAGLSNGR